jgi:hypothetical protein
MDLWKGEEIFNGWQRMWSLHWARDPHNPAASEIEERSDGHFLDSED